MFSCAGAAWENAMNVNWLTFLASLTRTPCQESEREQCANKGRVSGLTPKPNEQLRHERRRQRAQQEAPGELVRRVSIALARR
jgi:hypothetical protein